jgi:hypothetical protein
MIIDSFFYHTIYNVNKYQYNLHNFDSLKLRSYFLNLIFCVHFNSLCASTQHTQLTGNIAEISILLRNHTGSLGDWCLMLSVSKVIPS